VRTARRPDGEDMSPDRLIAQWRVNDSDSSGRWVVL